MAIHETIEFMLYAQDKDAKSSARAACRAFGIGFEEALRGHDTGRRIRCTPEQFGMFIALRVVEGVNNNQVLGLDIKILPGTRTIDYLDVRNNEYHPHPFPAR